MRTTICPVRQFSTRSHFRFAEYALVTIPWSNGGICALTPTCNEFGDCDVVWKVRQCTILNKWGIKANDVGHVCGAVTCPKVPPPRVTKSMREYIELQDEYGVPPRVILVNLKKLPKILHIDVKQGAKNTIKSIQEFVRARAYNTDSVSQNIYIFGAKLDSDGYAYVGSAKTTTPSQSV
ncbi:hypothetical protein GQ600_5759 [Phytophthora cactorum]|nr:hypothetical protein GQ600_5759 [Phytophthora cactorum]